ncbi:MAG: hypothetical protein NC252_08100 [Roseburia sp.]|nr:hypothetical protein [Roseburia sp.]MCM1511101.1 hypothetical protein [Clostridium sp.]
MRMNNNRILSIAETIRQQLVGMTPMNILMSWGISKIVATVIDDMAALKLYVNGRLHKGTVIIALNEGTDYYEVYLRDKAGNTNKIAGDIDFTQLGDTIDEAIERGKDKAEYDKFCEEQRRLLFL